MLDNLSLSLQDVVKRIAGARRIDPRTIEEMVKDIQRALLQADVKVQLVMGLSTRIRERALKEEPLVGANPREHIIRILYQELVDILGKGTDISLGKQTILMVGLYGGGKTTTVAKLARYFQKKGLKPAVICADSYRPGAYDQLKQLCEQINVLFYGERDSDPVTIVRNGLKEVKGDVMIIDTAGRHALESDLIEEMKQIHTFVKPDQNLLVLDGAMGQIAGKYAKDFDDAIGITGVILTKLDGTSKGGGALSAISETNSSIAFIGTGETLDDFERFDPDRFISRLLGMGDIKSLIERAEETSAAEDLDVESMIRGRFTLKDMYKQLEAVSKLGPLKQVMQMMPIGLGVDVSDETYQVTKDRLSRYKVIMDSMTAKEMQDPRIIGSSRIKRITMGSGTSLADVRELLKYHKMMQNAMKGFRGGKFPMRKLMKRFNM
ncbi:MAG: signal recognition particle protein Srp54 [Methanocellales archaeon]|nr:signal recognition particle protein Srp54 [Methanocellales archaeon]MDD3421674.1 signal recognition particle protein Srp54 [Methanocellales archaeon]MDD4898635.1 signal recognition particle protein Srp54 [Methanocellales archaeon]MDD5447301.1 signal recognition particle protein Srp54 [Methanocellales archaeon]